MDKKIENLLKIWQQHNIAGSYCADKNKAIEEILEIIPANDTIGACGSQTLEELGILKLLEERGNKVIYHNKPGISKEESMELRKQGPLADYYLASANGISFQGEMVFLSAWGHRIAGISNAKNVIVVAGVNKLVPDLESAIRRAKEYAMPLNYKRLNWDAARIMDCQMLVIETEASPNRLQVILVNENLGF